VQHGAVNLGAKATEEDYAAFREKFAGRLRRTTRNEKQRVKRRLAIARIAKGRAMALARERHLERVGLP
jgi:hypothetical protein